LPLQTPQYKLLRYGSEEAPEILCPNSKDWMAVAESLFALVIVLELRRISLETMASLEEVS
jgi:hypothetical protein